MCTNNEFFQARLRVSWSGCRPQKGLKCGWFECCFYWTKVITTPATADILQNFFKHVAGVLSHFLSHPCTIITIQGLFVLLQISQEKSLHFCLWKCLLTSWKGFLVPDNAFWTHKCLVVCSVFTITCGGTSFEACKPWVLKESASMLPAQALDIRPEHTVLEYQTQSLGGQHSLQGAKKTSHIYIYIYTPVWKST